MKRLEENNLWGLVHHLPVLTQPLHLPLAQHQPLACLHSLDSRGPVASSAEGQLKRRKGLKNCTDIELDPKNRELLKRLKQQGDTVLGQKSVRSNLHLRRRVKLLLFS